MKSEVVFRGDGPGIDGRFLILGERSIITTIAVDAKEYRELSPKVRVTGTPSWAPPVVANGLLYVRDDREIKCLDLRKGGAVQSREK